MAYATQADLETRYSSSLLRRLATRADDSPLPIADDTLALRVTAALEEASGLMDGYFQPCYYVPVSTTNLSGLALLVNCCAVLAVASLVRQHGYVAKSEDESLVVSAETWRSWLRDTAKGVVQIPGASATDSNPSSDQSSPRSSFQAHSAPPAFRGLDYRYC
jgi:phage gp36-like protein